MFTVTGKSARKPVAPPQMVDAGEKRVLPRPLRRIVRFCVSLAAGRIHIPAHTGTVSALAFLAATGFYGMSVGGHTDAFAGGVVAGAGFGVEDVRVSGNRQTSEIDILQLLGLDGTTSLVALDIEGARKKLNALPWVEDSEIRKIYPRTVEVRLREREAFAIWQHGQELSLIEKNGSVIAPLRDNKYASLPLFVGRDAETSAADFEEQMAAWPEIREKVRAYVRVSGRRWDLYLRDGMVVMLPDADIPQALQRLSRLDAEQQVLSRDVAAVDLRLVDRTTIRLTAGAAERRQAALDARSKMLRKAGQKI